jgi:hypothetical protein
MRPPRYRVLSDRVIQGCAQNWLNAKLQFGDHGPECTADRLWQIVMLAACRGASLSAVCQDLAGAPSHEAVRKALFACFPNRRKTLEQRLDATLCEQLPRWFRRHAVDVAIDLHLIPYHGEPHRSTSELFHSKPKAGTSKFHAYATACVVHQGLRYTLALTAVANREPILKVLERLLDRVAQRGVRIRLLLLDRQFSTKTVIPFLQERQIAFLMPLARHGRTPNRKKGKAKAKTNAKAPRAKGKGKPKRRGRRPKHPRKRRKGPRTPREFLGQRVGCYDFDWGTSQAPIRFTVVVATKPYTERKTQQRRVRKLIYAAWRVRGAPKELRERYRKRFGIESSYRQLGQARARTSSRDPRLRLFFVAVSLVLRNVWVWQQWLYFIRVRGNRLVIDARGRWFTYLRMRHWIETVLLKFLHDGSDFVLLL